MSKLGEGSKICARFSLDLLNAYGRQALSMIWDYTDVNPWCDSSGDHMSELNRGPKITAASREILPQLFKFKQLMP